MELPIDSPALASHFSPLASLLLLSKYFLLQTHLNLHYSSCWSKNPSPDPILIYNIYYNSKMYITCGDLPR